MGCSLAGRYLVRLKPDLREVKGLGNRRSGFNPTKNVRLKPDLRGCGSGGILHGSGLYFGCETVMQFQQNNQRKKF